MDLMSRNSIPQSRRGLSQLQKPGSEVTLEQLQEPALIGTRGVEDEVVEPVPEVVGHPMASSGSSVTIQRRATWSMGSSSASRSISIGSDTLCFCSGVRDSGAQNRVFPARSGSRCRRRS